MIVKWTAPNKGLLVVPNLEGNDIILQPGPNEVPTKTWEKCRVHVLDRIEAGHLVEIGATVAVEAVPEKKGPGGKVIEEAVDVGDITKVTEFKDLPVNEASKLASETTNLGTLNGWLSSETRGSVATAIRAQIEVLEKKAAGKSDKD